ncbi:Gfo/Idh/MocA family oxidoreductase [Lentisphaerota bacterium WC36G]|nr:Gfo/Idh/MocA family oxidoreductase [Lentisphaerae bacterium WC36]
MKAVEVIIVGPGSRGEAYAQYAKEAPLKCRIVGVAGPDDHRRQKMIKDFDLPKEMVFNCWSEVVAVGEKIADAVVICTHDDMHAAPAIAFANLKYNILLEKPMATTEDDCRRIVDAVKQNGIIFSVCHVLRYTNYSQKLKEIINSGVAGDIVNIQHVEPVGSWRHVHSYVRGNWRKESDSTFMLLSKSCHDLDWIQYIMDQKIARVSSFASLRHFKKTEQPQGAPERCLDCPKHIEKNCPYSAKRIYNRFLENGQLGRPLDTVVAEPNRVNIEEALRTGPYGRCVYACDNDVVDNQLVNIEFQNHSSASFMMTAFSANSGRKSIIYGTKAQITVEENKIEIFDFINEQTKTINVGLNNDSLLDHHDGGDRGVVKNFIEANLANDQTMIISGPDVSLETHLAVFKAEEARKNGTVELVV